MNLLALVFKFLTIVPGIAAGIHQLHAEKDLVTKTQLAQDSLALAVAGAQAVLPEAQASLATQAGAIVSTALSSTVAAIHSAANPDQA